MVSVHDLFGQYDLSVMGQPEALVAFGLPSGYCSSRRCEVAAQAPPMQENRKKNKTQY